MYHNNYILLKVKNMESISISSNENNDLSVTESIHAVQTLFSSTIVNYGKKKFLSVLIDPLIEIPEGQVVMKLILSDARQKNGMKPSNMENILSI